MNHGRLANYGLLKLPWIIFAIAAPLATANAMDQRANDEVSCRVVEAAARANQLPVAVLTRLLWYESRFQVDAVSRAGAQGIAQFMPATAMERGLGNPFDLDLAIPQAATFLAELEQRFRNMGLAIAAYNAGPSRIANWLDKTGSLPHETSRLVLAVTGRSPDEWEAFGPYIRLPLAAEPQSCIELRAFLRSVSLNDLPSARGHLVPGMEQKGRPLPGMNQSGQPLSGWQQSGRLLPSIGQSGRPRQ
jgi:hypothetical protein